MNYPKLLKAKIKLQTYDKELTFYAEKFFISQYYGEIRITQQDGMIIYRCSHTLLEYIEIEEVTK
jgi:hypothetical protein